MSLMVLVRFCWTMSGALGLNQDLLTAFIMQLVLKIAPTVKMQELGVFQLEVYYINMHNFIAILESNF